MIEWIRRFETCPVRCTKALAMKKVDPELFRQWKAGLDEHNRIVLEERRRATYQERFANLSAIWRQARFLGHLEPGPLDLSVNDTWQRLRRAYFQRHG